MNNLYIFCATHRISLNLYYCCWSKRKCDLFFFCSNVLHHRIPPNTYRGITCFFWTLHNPLKTKQKIVDCQIGWHPFNVQSMFWAHAESQIILTIKSITHATNPKYFKVQNSEPANEKNTTTAITTNQTQTQQQQRWTKSGRAVFVVIILCCIFRVVRF